MSLWDLVESPQTKNGINGVVVGIVTNNKDPEKLGRVKVKYPWLSEKEESNWARIASPMAGIERGIFVLPDVDDEVLMVFEHGDINRPYIVGSLWNGKDKPPETNSDGKNNIKIIKSRTGHTIKIDDTEGEEKIEIVDKTEGNKITIDSANNKISIVSGGDIDLLASDGKITIDATEIEIKSSIKIKTKDLEVKPSGAAKIEASGQMDLKTSAVMNIKGSTVNIN
ncbi:MAG: phage baseplate assembly protein V [Methanosarcina sp.]